MTREQILAAIASLQGLLGEEVPAVNPEEVYLPKTKSVFPRPRADLGEMFVGYVQRVGSATGRSTSSVGSLFLGTGHLGDARDPANWPEMADRFFNPRAYMTPEQLAEDDRRIEAWKAYTINMGK